MNKFFDYMLLASCGISMVAAFVALIASFLIEDLFGLGNPAPTICIASAFGGLYNAAVSWTLHKVLAYVSRKETI